MHKITKVIANVYDGDDFEDLKHLAADGHKVEIVGMGERILPADCFGNPILSKERD